MFDDPMTSCEKELTIVALSSVCLFEMRRQQAQFSYMTSVTNTNDKIELNV